MALAQEAATLHNLPLVDALNHIDVISIVPERARETWIDIWMSLLQTAAEQQRQEEEDSPIELPNDKASLDDLSSGVGDPVQIQPLLPGIVSKTQGNHLDTVSETQDTHLDSVSNERPLGGGRKRISSRESFQSKTSENESSQMKPRGSILVTSPRHSPRSSPRKSPRNSPRNSPRGTGVGSRSRIQSSSSHSSSASSDGESKITNSVQFALELPIEVRSKTAESQSVAPISESESPTDKENVFSPTAGRRVTFCEEGETTPVSMAGPSRKWIRSASQHLKGPENSKLASQKGDSVQQSISHDDLWHKYLKHFSTDDLNWFADAFQSVGKDESGCIPLEAAVQIVLVYMGANFHCQEVHMGVADAYDALQTFMPGQREVSKLNFELFISFIAAAQNLLLRNCPRAGWSHQKSLSLKATFKAHLKRRHHESFNSEPALRTQEIFEVLHSLNQGPNSVEEQQEVVQLIKDVDVDDSGTIDLEEFHQFMRQVDQVCAARKRRQEHTLMCQSNFSEAEVDGFHDLFTAHQGADGKVSLRSLAHLLSILDIEMTMELKKELAGHVQQVLGINTLQYSFSFGEFLVVFRRLIDTNFAYISTYLRPVDDDLSPDSDDGIGSETRPASSSWFRRVLSARKRASSAPI
eukprot:gnl/MRDRNA2_/MRDRNA2_115385_c0_seq1.p1 gnl/MRDRNA2_/MRDRNA2_115385_c0~~gnl/MRDRNA2_/MRDRNA2_115385_c0_seq1.p1  ORF type:complete len:690 (-),score=76.23 gnl/MRDRNA2_/MRDRNA2_115385_c0_seq1:106-2022(-)